MNSIEDKWKLCITKWLERQIFVTEAYFFGSRVKGTHKTMSDLDVGVVLRDMPNMSAAGINLFLLPEWRKEWAAKLPVPVDFQCIGYADDEDGIADQVIDHAVKFYERDET